MLNCVKAKQMLLLTLLWKKDGNPFNSFEKYFIHSVVEVQKG